MKLKSLFSVIGLGLFGLVGVGAGVAMSHGPEAVPVKADGEKWMITIVFDNTGPETSDKWGEIDDHKVHFWGTNVEYGESELALHPTGVPHLYTVNAVFTSTQTVSGIQIDFDEGGVEKQSQDITVSLNSSNNGTVYSFSFNDGAWVDGKWPYTSNGSTVAVGRYAGDSHDFVADPNTASYYYKDVELEAGNYVEFRLFANWDHTFAVTREDDLSKYISSYGTSWLAIKETGTYDFFFTNDYSDGGILSIKKHQAKVSSYIYYCTASDSLTGDRIFSFEGQGQFGAFPGKSISSIVGVKDVTSAGVLHFQGGVTGYRIYKIPVDIGYPEGDLCFLFANDEGDVQTSDFDLVAGAAYWWTGGANANAGLALDFLDMVETYRNAVTAAGDIKAYSICGISKANAKIIVDAYNDLDDDIKTTYVDCTKVYTYNPENKAEECLVSYADVIEQISVIAEVAIATSVDFAAHGDVNANAAIIVAVFSGVGVIALITFVAAKKRKKN